MAMHYRLGLIEGAGLRDDEVARVISTMRAGSLTERIDGRFYDVSVEGSVLLRQPSDEGVVDLLARLFDEPTAGAGADEAAYAELCVLVPGAQNPDYHTARAVEGVPGWAFKSLDVAHDELKHEASDLGHSAMPLTLSHLRRASSLSVAVVFGERQAK